MKKKTAIGIPFASNPSMTSVEWRNNAENRSIAASVLTSQEFTAMYSLLINERPSKTPLPIGADERILANQAMFNAGFEFCLEKLLSFMRENEIPHRESDPTFEPE